MHELAIVQDLLNLCESNARKNNAKKITKVEIEIGRLSGVEGHYLRSAFDAFKANSICEEANLIIHTKEVVIKCDECDFEGEILDNSFICPNCNSAFIRVIGGEDMYLMRIEME